MKTALALLLLAQPAIACDWNVSEKIDPMTDAKVCTITSPSVKLVVGVLGQNVSFASGSPLYLDFLTVRVDDQEAIALPERGRSTESNKPHARDLLSQIRTGKRLRVQFRDGDGHTTGDGEVCNLPALIDACAK